MFEDFCFLFDEAFDRIDPDTLKCLALYFQLSDEDKKIFKEKLFEDLKND